METYATTPALENEPLIIRTSGVCGGDARITGTRFPVWMLVQSRDAGCTDAEFLENYPFLTQETLNAAWEYARTHEEEVYRQIKENRSA